MEALPGPFPGPLRAPETARGGVTPTPGPQAASGPPQAPARPSLAERLKAMEAKHAPQAGTDWTEPRRAPNDDPGTMAQAVENVAAVLPVAWSRQFDQHTRDDGTTFYVDVTTGQVYDTLPALHHDDGKPT